MLEGKNIVVTGCLSGIGRQTLATFAAHGANVIACAYKKTEEYELYCRRLEKEEHVRITPVCFDMIDPDAIRDAARRIREEKIEIHGLVNIVGINRDAYFGMVSVKDMMDTF